MKMLCRKHNIEGELHRKGINAGSKRIYYNYVYHALKSRIVQCSQGRSDDQSPRKMEFRQSNNEALKRLRETIEGYKGEMVRKLTILREIEKLNPQDW